ncbi:anti-sigma F factor antagonist [Peribacillus kribbensis]|uniref:anti-sigma F factor antagonist n=1 Tax=Peribacillus kribbensis TaxID=356658 RepID=UPI00040741B8|nr:anti-sigma F factor antagonist [Peribacillus kribbensis]
MSLEIEQEIRDNILCIRLSGELDHHSAEDLKNRASTAIVKHNIRHIILNLEELSFMDSSGLGVVMGRYKQIKQNHGEMIVCAISPPVKRLFEMSGLLKIVKLELSEENALQKLGVA